MKKTIMSEEDEFSDEYMDLWVVKFMSIEGNKYLEKIEESFIQERFNLYGIQDKIEDFEMAYLAILDRVESKNLDAESSVYLLAHQRYICTTTGIENIHDRVMNKEFGVCQRVGCVDVPYIPTGISNVPHKETTKMYCYNCNNLYEPRGSLRRLDGCAWGVGFAQLLILNFQYNFEKPCREQSHIPRVYGFQLADPEENESK